MLEQPRNLERKAPTAGILSAGSNQEIGVADGVHGIDHRKPIALELDRIDQDLHQFIAVTGNLNAKDFGQGLDTVSEIATEFQERTLRHGARQRHHHHRE